MFVVNKWSIDKIIICKIIIWKKTIQDLIIKQSRWGVTLNFVDSKWNCNEICQHSLGRILSVCTIGLSNMAGWQVNQPQSKDHWYVHLDTQIGFANKHSSVWVQPEWLLWILTGSFPISRKFSSCFPQSFLAASNTLNLSSGWQEKITFTWGGNSFGIHASLRASCSSETVEQWN